MDKLSVLLAENKSVFKPVLPVILSELTTFHLDLSKHNPELLSLDITDNKVFESYLDQQLVINNNRIPLGGYNEKRVLYSRSDHFVNGDELRDIHLGIDIWIDAGTPLYAPLEAKVHSFSNNTKYRDYGPTVILEHKIENHTFYTLYGHLSLESLIDLYEGKTINGGEEFGFVGSPEVNGSWPPHLHFQLIKSMGKWKGDFPGVSSESEREIYLDNCPDPSAILGL